MLTNIMVDEELTSTTTVTNDQALLFLIETIAEIHGVTTIRAVMMGDDEVIGNPKANETPNDFLRHYINSYKVENITVRMETETGNVFVIPEVNNIYKIPSGEKAYRAFSKPITE